MFLRTHAAKSPNSKGLNSNMAAAYQYTYRRLGLPGLPTATGSLSRRRVLKFIASVLACALLLIAFLAFIRTPAQDPCLVRDTKIPVVKNGKLPKIIHQQWKDDSVLPAKHQYWQSTVKKTFPEYEYMLWTDIKMRKLLEDEFAWFLPTYDSFPQNIMRADAARPFILFKYGGLYADMDYEVVQNFWDRLPDDVPAVIESYSHYFEMTQNSLMSSPPKHPFWEVSWEIMQERVKAGSLDPIWVTGPRMIDESIRRYRKRIKGQQGAKDVVILPCENFQRVTWGEQALKHKLWKRFASLIGLFRQCGDVNDSRCLLGIHHGTTSWYA